MAKKRQKSQSRGQRYTQFLAVWITPEANQALMKIQDEVGILRSEQVRRAIDAWIAKNKKGGQRE